MSLGWAITHIYKGVHQRIDFLLGFYLFFSHIIQSLFIVHAITGIESATLFQLCNESIFILRKHFNLLHYSHIQSVTVGILAVAYRSLTAFFHLADIGVNHLVISSFAFAHFRIHTLTATTEQQTSQKCFVAAWLSERFGFITFQRFLNLYPHLARNQTRMLADRYNPLACRQVLGGSAFFLIGTVVSHDTVLIIKFIFFRKQIGVMLNKEVIGIFIRNHINRILQNSFDGKTGKIIIVLCLNALFNQSGFGQCQRISFYI